MKISNIELTKEKLIIALCAVALAATFMIYITVYKPLINKLKMSYVECKTCEKQASDARGVIEVAGKTTGDRMLVSEKNTLFAIDELTKHGKALGINFVSMKPGNIIDDNTANYKILPIDMEIEAQDEQASKFIGSLDELKKVVIKVKSFDITPDKNDLTKVKVRLTVDMYLSKRDYAE